jgi:uncharacterized protein (TIGR04222 family)
VTAVNPFDLRGPQFLAFYWALTGFCVVLLLVVRSQSHVGGEPTRVISDPYLLAYLRVGRAEVVRVALLSLIQDGVVVADRRVLSLPSDDPPRPPPPGPARPRTPLEDELVARLREHPATADQLVAEGAGTDTAAECAHRLEELGYLRGAASLQSITIGRLGAITLLITVAFIKVAVAVSRGRSNVFFLGMSSLAATGLLWTSGAPARMTVRGRNALDAAAGLLSGARKRLYTPAVLLRTEELALIAAVFGFADFDYAHVNFLFWSALRSSQPSPALSATNASSGCGSTVSSCSSTSSSCSSGGGSSCGGGGSSCGGGGCGGCGGG